MNPNKLPQLMAGAGVFGGMLFGIKGKNSLTITALYAIGFGIAGYYVGRTFNKYYGIEAEKL